MSNSRASGIDKSLFKEMREAGCWQIAFGLEFGSNRILGLANKGPYATIEEHRKTILAAAEAGIAIDGHFMLGYPGETEENLRETIDFACRLPITFAHFYVATPFPGSKLYEEAKEKKWLVRENWRNINQEITILETPWLSHKTVERYINQAYKKFYFRPKAIYRIIRIAETPTQLFNILVIGVRFIYGILKK